MKAKLSYACFPHGYMLLPYKAVATVSVLLETLLRCCRYSQHRGRQVASVSQHTLNARKFCT